STPNVSHSTSTPCFARQGAVTSPPAPVVAAALCTACPMIVNRSTAYARPAANGPAMAAVIAADSAFRTFLRACIVVLLGTVASRPMTSTGRREFLLSACAHDWIRRGDL